MTRYILLAIDDEEQARDLLEDAAHHPGDELLTPSQENRVAFRIAGGVEAMRHTEDITTSYFEHVKYLGEVQVEAAHYARGEPPPARSREQARAQQ
jgi:hypothetical protein